MRFIAMLKRKEPRRKGKKNDMEERRLKREGNSIARIEAITINQV